MGAETETADSLHYQYKSLFLVCHYIGNALYVYVVRVLKYIKIYLLVAARHNKVQPQGLRTNSLVRSVEAS